MSKIVIAVRGLLGRRGFASDVLGTSAANAVILACGLMTGLLTARVLGPSGRGELALIQMYGTLAAIFCCSGFSAAVVYFSRNDPARIPGVLYRAALNGLALAALAAVVALGVIAVALLNQSAEIRSYASLYLVYIPLALGAALVLASMQAALQVKAWNLARILQALLWLVPLALIASYTDVDAHQLAIVYLVFLAVFVSALAVVTVRRYRGASAREVTSREMWTYALPISLGTLVSQAALRPDLVIISVFGNASQVGLYVVAVAYAALLTSVLSALVQLTLPKMSSISARAERITRTATLSRMAAVAAVAAAVFFIVLAPAAVPLLFGRDYGESIPLAMVLLVGSAATFVSAILAECLRSLSLVKRPLASEAMGTAVAAVAMWPLYSIFGIVGAAAASVAGSIVGLVCISYYAASDLGVPYRDLLRLRRGDVALIAAQVRHRR